MMKQPSAVPRALIWAALGAFALYGGISLGAVQELRERVDRSEPRDRCDVRRLRLSLADPSSLRLGGRAAARLVRYWARAFGRGQPITKELRLYWTCWYDKHVDSRVASAWWLRAKDPASAGFFRDASLEFLPLNTPHAELDARIEQWRQRFAQLTEGRVAISTEPRPELV